LVVFDTVQYFRSIGSVLNGENPFFTISWLTKLKRGISNIEFIL